MSLTRRGSCILSAIIFALVCLFILSPTGHCETKFPPGYKPAILKIVNLDISQYPKVTCEVLFRDYHGKVIPLDESISLRLFEDEIPLTDVVRESRQMIATLLLVDTSGSMSGKMDHVAKGVEAYLNRIGPDDRVMVMEFNSWRGETPVVQKFTNDAESILGGIRDLKPRGQTALYDAIADGGDWFYPKFAKATKIMIVLSDGEDNNSVREWFNAMDFAEEHDIRVFFIALGPDADVRMFRRIARATGGEVFTSLKEEMLPTAYESVSTMVRSTRTVLTYETTPDTTADGRPHYVQVAAYSGAARWATSELKSFKFRILKTAEEFAKAEKEAQEAKEREKALEDKQVGESPAAKPTDEAKAAEVEDDSKPKDDSEQKKEVEEEEEKEGDKTKEEGKESEESESGE